MKGSVLKIEESESEVLCADSTALVISVEARGKFVYGGKMQRRVCKCS
jgi:hypothetical protein